jgi:hypothetical protein
MTAEVASLRDDNTTLRDELARPQTALANLRVRYYQLLEELHLLKRRLVVAKAERLDDVAKAQLAFDRLLAKTQAMEKILDAADAGEDTSEKNDDAPSTPKDKRRRGSVHRPPADAISIVRAIVSASRRAAAFARTRFRSREDVPIASPSPLLTTRRADDDRGTF